MSTLRYPLLPPASSPIRALRLVVPAALALLLLVTLGLSRSRVDAAQVSATYAHGTLSVTLPYHAPRAGSGKLTLEVLDPEDHVLSQTTHTVPVAAGDGVWQQTLTPEKSIPLDDLVWQRLRFRFDYERAPGQPAGDDAAIEGIHAISEILRRPVVHILGQTDYLAGSQAVLRIIVSDNAADPLPLAGSLRIDLIPHADASADAADPAHTPPPHTLFSGRLNRRGTLEAPVRFPAGLSGAFDLHFIAETPVGETDYTQPIHIAEKASLLLTTEKPIYQPGQTIHVRALALATADLHANASRPLTFELEDSRGNKVFKRATATDKFGIASAEFTLADEVNLGAYHLRALLFPTHGDASSPASSAEITLNVERYVLPKFKVAVDFASVGGKPRKDFRPGDHVTGTVRATYFFGKPVDHAAITVKASSADVDIVEAASAHGTTDADGAFKFDLRLPSYFTGKPLSQGAARALVEATVTDNASHAETRGEPITISQTSLLITAVPEGGKLIPHLDNQVFLLTSYPDGTPAATSLTVHASLPSRLLGAADTHATTDAGGVAVIHLTPGTGLDSLQIEADDHHGNRASLAVPLETRQGADQVLLRTSQAIAKAGDRLSFKVLSTRSRGTAYVDIVRNGQTILTRDLDLQNGEASLTLTATPDMAGTLDVNAYLFSRDAQTVADHRLLFIQPADELHIATTADAASYKPGSEARLQFHVTNQRGEGVSAALGLQIVDEAVFALAEKQPGFAKVFFLLEQEAMKPRYEIHSLSLASVVAEPAPGAEPQARQDLAARALFSATELATTSRLDTEFGRALPEAAHAAYDQRYLSVFNATVGKLADGVNDRLSQSSGRPDIAKLFAAAARESATRDSWGTALHIERPNWGGGPARYFLIRSAGPNQRFNDGDDLTAYLEERAATFSTPTGRGGRAELHIDHDRGPSNGRAALNGTVLDTTGAVIPQATITVRLTGGATATAHSNPSGAFTLAALLPGAYTVEIASPGFKVLRQTLQLAARDSASLRATLEVGAVGETVTVSPAHIATRGRVAVRKIAFAEQRAFGGPPVPMPLMDMAPPAPPASAPRIAMAQAALAPASARSSFTKFKAEPAAPHVRSFFPEALYINPEILTDAHGNASITIPVADSITTWRMAMLASTQSGALGTATSSLKVFQDFFVDLDLPVTLTQGDRVSLPVAVYNYTAARGDASLRLEPADWYTLAGDSAAKSVSVDPGRVGGSQFTLNANRIGKFKLTLSAQMSGHADVVVREIEVVPNGQEQALVFNGRIEADSSTHAAGNSAGSNADIVHDLRFPADSIPDATSLLVRLYPGPLSQVIEGMDSILRMPGGCFEQTSSSTYPNVLALDYLKRTRKLSPEVHAKAEGYIANGYQRLLTFEVPGGGFSWFGEAPANKILTGYGLMEFNDMSKVYDVDPRLITRTRDWLISQQQPDGSWKPDTSFINEGATNRYNTHVLRITAYIAWSLANTGYQGPAIEKAKQYIESHSAPHSAPPDSYTLAIIANFAADYSSHSNAAAAARDFTNRAMQALLDARTSQGETVLWNSEETGVYSTGKSAAIETTGLAVQALLKWGQANEVARKALAFIASQKDATGAWGTTQATITSLRALLLATQLSTGNTHGTVTVTLDGKLIQTLQLTPDNNDLLHQFVVKGLDAHRQSRVQLHFDGAGGLAYQVVGRYFTPWEQQRPGEPLSIDLAYDRTRLASNDIVAATATVRNNLPKTANMVMVDLGIPPGFDLLAEDLQAMVEKTAMARSGKLEKFSLTATQAILYFNSLAPHSTSSIHFRLRAKYPIRAKTFESRVYQYYDPAVTATAAPAQFEVSAK